ncbi:MAG: hypothetical protein PHQ33_00095 [Bacteroidales bacterium]|jgi:hypothetical protein|nr:plasmid pRiA4b ORF-3 family protein [Bacteroidales bacterium]MDD4394280.1 hypothetical protein [Bacteroidales bacterium]
MYFYKFRVYYDEIEDFVRDIEIISSDNFESLHKALLAAIQLSGQELASFYICDTKWNKQKEISLIDMQDESEKIDPHYDDEDEFALRSKLPIFVMKDSLLKDFITDPHQHIIFEYDFLNPKIFYIELLKSLPAEKGVTYPRCSYKVKDFPKENLSLNLPNPEDDYLDNQDLEDDLDNDFPDGYDDQLDLSGFDEFKEY